VVVGGSLAGATAALSLRDLGYDGDLVLVGEESELPYERPALSKEYLLATMTREQIQVRPQSAYDELGIDLRLGVRATGLDANARHVLLGVRDEVPYSSLVIATGARNIRPPIPGLDLPGVHQLRTLDDATALRAAATPGARAVVVGMGFIGAEVAATLTELGVTVTAVDAVPSPLETQLGHRLSRLVRGWHEEHAVQMLFSRSVSAISPAGSQLTVTTSAGDALPADLVVVGVGVRPDVDWLLDTALHLPAGVGVDGAGRTNLPDVYAAGDVAARWDERTGRHLRTEHWSNAIEQGKRVACAILGVEAPPEPAPYFWSAQYGHYLQYVGEPGSEADLIVREQGGRLTGFFVEDGIVRGGVTIDNGKELRHVRALIGRAIDPGDLADPSIDVRALGARLLA
jgi:3-phenylpropionate/trans-cinnamate dioxygenase ferredoxin reductase subunit